MKKNLLCCFALITIALLVGCDEEDSQNTQNTTVPEIVDVFADNLAKQSIARDPAQTPPTPNEKFLLDQQDQLLRAQVFSTNRFQFTLQRVTSAVDLANSIEIYVHEDFRGANIPAGGGMAGHGLFVIDGKFLDILGDYSNFLALQNFNLVNENPVNVLDAIVNWHNSGPPGAARELYPYQSLPTDIKALSDQFLDAYAGAIVYHEFGHYFLYHALDRLRANGTFNQFYIEYTSLNEDDADRLAGALMRKAGYDLVLGQEMIDLMAFYALNRNGTVFSILQITASLPAQFVPSSINYSSLSVRKQLFAEGYQRYSDYLAAVD